MNNTFTILKKQCVITPMAVFISSLLCVKGMAQCQAPTLKFHSPVLLSGTEGQQGAIYLFAEVIPNVDAHIEVLGLYGGATLYNIDDSTGVGYYDAFQPYVGGAPNDTSYIDWKISFKVAGTNNDTTLPCLAVTGVDVDGDNAALQEFIEAATPGSIAVDSATILSISFDGVRSKAISTIYNIPLIDTNHREAMFQMNFTNISTLLYRNGAISTWGAEQIRQTCIYFKPFFENSTFTILPAMILSFTAKSTPGSTKLEWSATNEIDIENYTVEKSADGKTWKDLKTISPGSANTINHYVVTDIGKNIGTTYYRVMHISTHGLVKYSKIIQVNHVVTTEKTVIHNTIIKNTLNFQIYGTANDVYTVEYYTMTGSKIKQDRLQIRPGINSESIQLTSQFSPGFYFLVIKNKKGQHVHSSKVIKN